MPRVLFVCQEKGGVGKSLVARALAEAVPEIPIIEIDSARRLVELEDRVEFFPMRAERSDIENTGGQAARAEFDGVIHAVAATDAPTIVDVGANTSKALLTVLADLSEGLMDAGIEAGVLVVVTSEQGALAHAPDLLGLAKPWAKRFVLENRLNGPVDPKELKTLAADLPVSVLDKHVMENEAVRIVQDAGLRIIPDLDPKDLNQRYGLALASRVRRDLTKLRANAMEAVRGPAEWLVGG